MRTPLYRREARAAYGDTNKIFFFIVAALMNLAAILAVNLAFSNESRATLYASAYLGLNMRQLIAGIAATAAIDLFAVLGGCLLLLEPVISSLAREKERGTMEALVITPLSRRTIVWAKLLGGTAPARWFMWAVAPVCPLSAITLFYTVAVPVGFDRFWGWPVWIGLLAVLSWAVVFLVMHFAAAVMLYCSAKAGSTLAAYIRGTIVGFCLPVCLGYAAPVYYFVLGWVLFGKLVKNFDEYALPD